MCYRSPVITGLGDLLVLRLNSHQFSNSCPMIPINSNQLLILLVRPLGRVQKPIIDLSTLCGPDTLTLPISIKCGLLQSHPRRPCLNSQHPKGEIFLLEKTLSEIQSLLKFSYMRDLVNTKTIADL